MNQSPENLKLPSTARRRDPRLDFFRGIGMFIIFMAHMPGNWFTLYIPARFGFSDATEIFVFCSGMASAIAFGKIFSDTSWLMGLVRIVYRMWQVYWAHIGLFFATLLLVIFQTQIAATGALCEYNPERFCTGNGSEPWNYIGRLNIIHIFEPTNGIDGVAGTTQTENFFGIMTLTWVPNLFDILPMYIVVLAMIPVVMGIKMLSNKWFALGFIALVWLIAQDGVGQLFGFSQGLNLPAEPWSNRTWFFNPFGWQLVFFTGFAFMMGWLPKPPVKVWLVVLAAVIVLIYVPFSFWGIYRNVDNIVLTQEAARGLFGVENLGSLLLDHSRLKQEGLEPFTIFQVARENYWEFMEKSDVGILRYLHFLLLAYIFWSLAGEGGRNLDFKGALGRNFVKVVHKVGQQSLAVFLASIVLSRFGGFILDIIGKSWSKMILVNGSGILVLIGVAYLVGWLKKTPWKPAKKEPAPEPVTVTNDMQNVLKN
ncbi:MAG: OpgC domain-containing protein [Pseudomonadota bacterium]